MCLDRQSILAFGSTRSTSEQVYADLRKRKKKNTHGTTEVCVHRRSLLKAGFHHDLAWSAKKGG